ncbi:MAG: hypothetical protein AAFZ65_07145, partial [Planctomycetota bacterium]
IGSTGLLPPGGYLHLGLHSLALAPDAWTDFSLNSVNQGPFVQNLGILGPDGTASAAISIPGGLDPTTIGLRLFHAAIVFEPVTGVVQSTSVAAELEIGL